MSFPRTATGNISSRSDIEKFSAEGNTKENVARRRTVGTYYMTATVTTTGADGSAAGTASFVKANNDTDAYGVVDTIYVDWAGTAPATSDLAIYINDGDGYPPQKIMEVLNSVTDRVFRPVVPAHTADGTVATGHVKEFAVCASNITASISQSNALAPCATIYLILR